jgi:hypothetical protein
MCDAIYTIVLAKRKKNALDKKKHDNTYIFLIFSYIKEKKIHLRFDIPETFNQPYSPVNVNNSPANNSKENNDKSVAFFFFLFITSHHLLMVFF